MTQESATGTWAPERMATPGPATVGPSGPGSGPAVVEAAVSHVRSAPGGSVSPRSRASGLPSPTLLAVALLALAACTAFVWSPELAGALVAAVAAAFVVDLILVRRAPQVVRHLPSEVARGAQTSFSVTVAPRPGVRVRVRQPQTADVRFQSAEGPEGLDGTVVALRRGIHTLGPAYTRSTGPLRLARRDHSHAGAVEIASHADLPAARRLATAVRQGRFRDPGMRRGPLGLGTDFETIREYAPDDDIRRMNWLATERVGRPMVNQYREDTERDLWCLVDAGRLSSSPVEERTRLDVALDSLAAVAAVADVVGDRVGAVVFDDRVRRTVRPRRANAAKLVRLLDELQPNVVDSDYEGAFAAVAGAKRSLVIVFTDLLDVAASRPLLAAVPVLVRRHAVLIVSVDDPDLVGAVTRSPGDRRDLLTAGVATELLAEQDQVRARLSGAGAVVVTAPVDGLASRCVAAYLRLKANARL